ncbi:MAG: hypothetical protein ACI9JO_001648, partial [Psychrobacter okhotskensis]
FKNPKVIVVFALKCRAYGLHSLSRGLEFTASI